MATIHLSGSELDELPAVCMRCGAPATVTRDKTFSWHPPWVILLAFIGLLPFVIVALLLTQRVTVTAPLCARHRNHWLSRALIGWGGFALLVLLAGGGLFLLRNHPDLTIGDLELGGLLCVGSVVGVPVLLIIAVILRYTSIYTSGISGSRITLRGVAEEFAEALRAERQIADRSERHAREFWQEKRRQVAEEERPVEDVSPALNEPATYRLAPTDAPPPRPTGAVRCPACGQQALPAQSRCLYCNARLHKASPVRHQTSTAVQAEHDPAPGPGSAAGEGETKTCPGCGTLLQPRAVLCVGCGYDLRTGKRHETLRAARLGEDEETGSSAPARQRQHRTSLAVVRVGLGFHQARMLLYLLGGVLLVLVTAFSAPTKGQQPGPLFLLLFFAALGLLGLQMVLGMVGSVLCFSVPAEARARGYIVASFLLDVAAIPLGVFIGVAGLPPLVGAPLGVFGWVLFMLFMRNLADYLDLRDSTREAVAIIRHFLLYIVLPPLVIVLVLMWGVLGTALATTVPTTSPPTPATIPTLALVILPGIGLFWVFCVVRFFFILFAFIGGVRDGIRVGR
jgi:hypothetical protein